MSPDSPAPSDVALLPHLIDVPAGDPPWARAPIPALRVAETPVTVEQYAYHLADVERSTAPPGRRRPSGTGSVEHLEAWDSRPATPASDARHAVTSVTWVDAANYCSWLAARLGLPCRLLTADEWRWCAAGLDDLTWSLGARFDRDLYAPSPSAARAVDEVPANHFGLRQLTGDVFEWCADLVSHSPTHVSRVVKGGAFTVRNPESFDSAASFSADQESAVPYIGFRVVVTD